MSSQPVGFTDWISSQPVRFIVKAGVFSREQFSATSLFKLIFTLVSLSIIKIPSLGNIELVKLFYTVWLRTMGTQGRQV